MRGLCIRVSPPLKESAKAVFTDDFLVKASDAPSRADLRTRTALALPADQERKVLVLMLSSLLTTVGPHAPLHRTAAAASMGGVRQMRLTLFVEVVKMMPWCGQKRQQSQ